jgi:hypothetical protein
LTKSVKICHFEHPANFSQTVNPGDMAKQTIPALPGFVYTVGGDPLVFLVRDAELFKTS